MAESAKPKKENSGSRSKLMPILLICAIAGGAYALFQPDIREKAKQWFAGLRGSENASSESSDLPPIRPNRGNQIFIATFNASPLDEAKLSSPAIVDHLANTIRNFDIVALQNIQLRNPDRLNVILKKLNSRGRYYKYVKSPGQIPSKRPFNAFIYDEASVLVDSRVMPLNDQKGRFSTEPIAALFCVRGPPADQAFTFIALNVYIDPAEREAELKLLPNIWDSVKNARIWDKLNQNGSKEDDIILCASLQTPPPYKETMGYMRYIEHALENRSNMVGGNTLDDNILYDTRATVERMGESAVYDLGRRLGLKPEETSQVTHHLPVWATFSIYEGGERR